MNNLTTFNFEDNSIRVIEKNGEPWFCGKDVASSLGYVDATKALSQHCRQDGVAKHPLIDSLGREQDTTFINKAGQVEKNQLDVIFHIDRRD